MLHQHFKTPQVGGAIRSYYLAKALVDRGHKVVVITIFNEKESRIENVEGIEVHYLPIAYDNSFKFYARSWSFIKYMTSTAAHARKFQDFDKVYAISVPLTVGLIARWIKFRFKIPYIFEVGDLWPDAPIQMGFVKNYFFQRSLYSMERKIYQQAESIVALSTSIQAEIENKTEGKKIHLVPNMADCDFYRPGEKNLSLEEKFGVTGKFVVSYIGALGVANGLYYFLECASQSQKANLPIHFMLCGEGAVRAELVAAARAMDLQNISITGFVSRPQVKDILSVTDASFISYKNVPILETGSPNKFFDALAAGKLIVVNFEGWIKKEIEENQCGFYSDKNDPTDFIKRIGPFIVDNNLLKEYQQRARLLAERKYSRKIISNTFSDLFA